MKNIQQYLLKIKGEYMKSLVSAMLLFGIVSGVCQAQSGWYSVYFDSTALETIYFTDANTGYAGGLAVNNFIYYPRIIRTVNAGLNWVRLLTPADTLQYSEFTNLFFGDANTGFAAVYNSGNGCVIKTTNGGTNWTIVLQESRGCLGLCFLNSNTGYVVGGVPPFVKKTTDCGNNWLFLNIPVTSGNLVTAHFINVNTGWVVGSHKQIIKTTNGGNNWALQSSYVSGQNLWGVSFVDANTGVVVGGLTNNTFNIILRTTNGGNNWNNIQYSDTTCIFYNVRFIPSSSTGFIMGQCGQILKSTNAGSTWNRQFSPVNLGNADCFFTNINTGYIAGIIMPSMQMGYVLKTTDGGGVFVEITPIANEVPDRYLLYQNYPNPFNPITKIKFGIPKSEYIKLIVFDVLGREVATLINEQLKPGGYEVEWNGSNYPSGVYFYKLTSGDFSETKKMILVK